MEEARTIPARRGAAAFVRRGQMVQVINTHGEQVVDTWAFVRHDLREFMSMEHTRATLVKIMPAVGDCLFTTRRRPILKIVEDTSPGIHDTLMAACDSHRYGLLGCTGYHDNCTRPPVGGDARTRAHATGDAEPAQPVHEHPWRSGGELSFDPPSPGPATPSRSRRSSTRSWSSPPAPRTSCPSTGRRDSHRSALPDPRRRGAARRKCGMSAYVIAEVEVTDPRLRGVIAVSSRRRSRRSEAATWCGAGPSRGERADGSRSGSWSLSSTTRRGRRRGTIPTSTRRSGHCARRPQDPDDRGRGGGAAARTAPEGRAGQASSKRTWIGTESESRSLPETRCRHPTCWDPTSRRSGGTKRARRATRLRGDAAPSRLLPQRRRSRAGAVEDRPLSRTGGRRGRLAPDPDSLEPNPRVAGQTRVHSRMKSSMRFSAGSASAPLICARR